MLYSDISADKIVAKYHLTYNSLPAPHIPPSQQSTPHIIKNWLRLTLMEVRVVVVTFLRLVCLDMQYTPRAHHKVQPFDKILTSSCRHSSPKVHTHSKMKKTTQLLSEVNCREDIVARTHTTHTTHTNHSISIHRDNV